MDVYSINYYHSGLCVVSASEYQAGCMQHAETHVGKPRIIPKILGPIVALFYELEITTVDLLVHITTYKLVPCCVKVQSMPAD